MKVIEIYYVREQKNYKCYKEGERRESKGLGTKVSKKREKKRKQERMMKEKNRVRKIKRM